jgi:4-hydroxybenzoate polyprenyltransferase
VKRVSWLSHLVLGVADSGAPLGGWLAVTGRLSPSALLLGGAVALWVGGFDLIYACQDVEVDRREGLESVPARFGVAAALRLSSWAHALTVALLAAVGILQQVGLPYALALGGAAGLLVYEHRLVSPRDLSRLDAAFFAVNGYMAILLLAGTLLDQVLLRGALH